MISDVNSLSLLRTHRCSGELRWDQCEFTAAHEFPGDDLISYSEKVMRDDSWVMTRGKVMIWHENEFNKQHERNSNHSFHVSVQKFESKKMNMILAHFGIWINFNKMIHQLVYLLIILGNHSVVIYQFYWLLFFCALHRWLMNGRIIIDLSFNKLLILNNKSLTDAQTVEGPTVPEPVAGRSVPCCLLMNQSHLRFHR